MYRERVTDFRVKLRFDEIDRDTRYAFLRGDIVEVDLVGDPPGMMAVQDLVIAGTDLYLDYDEYEITEEEPTVVAEFARVFREKA
jgi:hypothetical protein